MVAELSLVSVNLATTCIGSMLYGAFLVLFILSTYLLTYRGRHTSDRFAQPSSHKSIYRSPMLFAGLALSVLVTAQWIMVVVRTFDAFVNFEGGTNPTLYFADLRQPTEATKLAFFTSVVLISDALITWRLYIIWGRNIYIATFPMLTWFGLLASGIGLVYQFANFPLGADVYVSAAGRWILSDCIFTFCTNVYCTSMIAFRIFRSRKMKQFGGGNVTRVISIMIESAAIYTCWNIFFVGAYLAKSNLNFPGVDIWCPVAGIANMLISVRIGLGWAVEDVHSSFQAHVSTPGPVRPVRPVEVNVSTAVRMDDFGADSIRHKQYDGSFGDEGTV